MLTVGYANIQRAAMKKPDRESACQSTSTSRAPEYPTTDFLQTAEQRRLDETHAWDERIMRNMQRMARDEKYRMEIAKKLT